MSRYIGRGLVAFVILDLDSILGDVTVVVERNTEVEVMHGLARVSLDTAPADHRARDYSIGCRSRTNMSGRST